ncbi:MAG: TonB-dependent receptor [Gemmatimonadetes bacterium]|nr:TonB-dependent receptor [Gemmatimonadota bacterium]
MCTPVRKSSAFAFMVVNPIYRTVAWIGMVFVPQAADLSLSSTGAFAQVVEHAGEVEGVVRDSGTGAALAGSLVAVVGAGRTAITHGDGMFHLPGIEPGSYFLRVERLGYRGRTIEVELGDEGAFVEIGLEPSPIAVPGLVVTAMLTERGASEALRPVGVISGEELQRRMTGTVAETLASIPGLAATSMGPAASRPVIRGLSGDRVLMLEDGSRVGDVSGAGPDHATAVDPLAARRIEVVRGPASLLYGSNVLGGVINVIRDEIPSGVPHHATGAASLQLETASEALAAGAHTTFAVSERIPLRLEVTGRTSGDLRTPAGQLGNTSVETLNAGAGGSRVGDWGHVGGSVRGYRNHYGIPGGFVGGHTQGVRIEMERAAVKAQAAINEPAGAIGSVEFDGAYTWYRHKELESENIIGTLFRLQTLSGDLLARHHPWGPFSGGVAGVRAAWDGFGYGGSGVARTDTPDTQRSTVAAYLFEEIDLGAVRIEAGLRYDWVFISPARKDPDSDIGNVRDRSFHAASASLGLLHNIGAGMTVGASLARAFRTPDVTELFSEGPHLAAYTFEIGNPSLGTEQGTGVDLFARFESVRFRAELAGFYNRIRGYIYGEETGRLSRVLLPIYQFQSNDAVLAGFEGSLNWDLGRGLALQALASSVRGTLTGTDRPIPLIPPLKGRVGIEYERPTWFVGWDTEMAAEQDRVGAFESATKGYTVFNASAGVRLTMGGRLSVITVSLDNVTNKEYRDHLSRVKEIMPEAGRGLSLGYRVVF